ncbi:hypothetical protein MHU86_16068 [Fragilaria crotonensis]|nr:hypothetical protein MHU86_16068 [Fragilaria crotonensis]
MVPSGIETPVLMNNDKELDDIHSRNVEEQPQHEEPHTLPSDNSTDEEQSERGFDVPKCIFITTEQEEIEDISVHLAAAPRSPQKQDDKPLWQKRGRFLIWLAHLGDHFDHVLLISNQG